jgi:general stress protein YciG
MTDSNVKGRGRGFASMDAEKQRQIASLGGRAAHQQGTAHEFSSEEAREAGRKGGEAVSANRAHMAAIGRKGGEASHRGSATNRAVDANRPQTQPTSYQPRVAREADGTREISAQA